MPNDENLGFINAQLTIARWYLERATSADSVTASNHVRSARHAYDVVVTLLPKITLRVQPESYAEVQRQLLALRARLKATGESV